MVWITLLRVDSTILRVDSTILSVDFHSQTKWSVIWLLKEWISISAEYSIVVRESCEIWMMNRRKCPGRLYRYSHVNIAVNAQQKRATEINKNEFERRRRKKREELFSQFSTANIFKRSMELPLVLYRRITRDKHFFLRRQKGNLKSKLLGGFYKKWLACM